MVGPGAGQDEPGVGEVGDTRPAPVVHDVAGGEVVGRLDVEDRARWGEGEGTGDVVGQAAGRVAAHQREHRHGEDGCIRKTHPVSRISSVFFGCIRCGRTSSTCWGPRPSRRFPGGGAVRAPARGVRESRPTIPDDPPSTRPGVGSGAAGRRRAARTTSARREVSTRARNPLPDSGRFQTIAAPCGVWAMALGGYGRDQPDVDTRFKR